MAQITRHKPLGAGADRSAANESCGLRSADRRARAVPPAACARAPLRNNLAGVVEGTAGPSRLRHGTLASWRSALRIPAFPMRLAQVWGNTQGRPRVAPALSGEALCPEDEPTVGPDLAENAQRSTPPARAGCSRPSSGTSWPNVCFTCAWRVRPRLTPRATRS